MSSKTANSSKIHLFNQIFESHFIKFVQDQQLLNKENLILSISGGIDSMVLLDLFIKLNNKKKLKNNIKVLHFNHQTRGDEHYFEKENISKICEVNKVEMHYVKLNFKNNKNFENEARKLRHSFYKKYAKKFNANIVLAQHIDDSFEWSLMQSGRSANIFSTLGIPCKNKNIIRPFMCFTKKQIQTYAILNQIKFFEDSTNKDNKFLRNFYRNKVIYNINSRSKAHLKHYVARSTELSLILNYYKLEMKKKIFVTKNENKFKISFDFDLVKIQKNDLNFYLLLNQLKKIINKINPNMRSSIHIELEKRLINFKNPKKSGEMKLKNNFMLQFNRNGLILYKKTQD